MSDELTTAREAKLRLGGMALANGLLVHGPTSWAAAVRRRDGGIAVASGRKPRLRAGMALVAHGEFSIVIAGLGAGLEPHLGPLSAAYLTPTGTMRLSINCAHT